MATGRRRDVFTKDVVDRLAKRAAHTCSNPACRRRQIEAAHRNSSDIVHTGVAAHITAASPGGPRYDQMFSQRQRRSIDNAIYLCAVCAAAVDKNRGVDFEASTLLEWKRQHEAWVRDTFNQDPTRLTASERDVSVSPTEFSLGSGGIKAVELLRVTNLSAVTLYTVGLQIAVHSSVVTAEQLKIDPPVEARGPDLKVGTPDQHLLLAAGSLIVHYVDEDTGGHFVLISIVAIHPNETVLVRVENVYPGLLPASSAHLARASVVGVSHTPPSSGQIALQ